MSGRAVAVVLALVTGCTPAAQPEGDAAGPLLIPSLNVTVEGDSVHMLLHVTSGLDSPVVLEFPTSQRADFRVDRPDGETVWMWSAARSFGQVVGSETLAAGGTLSYEATWTPPVPGRYEGVAWLVSGTHPVRIAVPFEVGEADAARGDDGSEGSARIR